MAPSALAMETLELLPTVPAGVAAFGTKLCADLAELVNISGAVYGLLASLAAAVYYSKGAVWFIAGWTILYGTHPTSMHPRVSACFVLHVLQVLGC